ncbi:MAG: hypothetical protein ACKO3C_08625 [Betaproteobacteria bacterium]
MNENQKNFKESEEHRGHRGHKGFSHPEPERTLVALLEQVHALDIGLTVDGTHLDLDFEVTPPPDLIEQLAKHKAGIIQFLSRSKVDLSSTDWQGFFDERVRFAESLGLQSDRAHAEAHRGCVNRWIIRNPTHSRPGICAACGVREGLLQPYVTDHVHNDHTWLHPPCATEWFEARRALAASELAKLGIAMLGGLS